MNPAETFQKYRDAASVTEGGAPAERAKGVSFLRSEDGCAVYAVESGRYAFVGKE